MPHFIYCGDFIAYEDEEVRSIGYLNQQIRERIKEIFLEKMREYKIRSSVLTMLFMERSHLITKEKVKRAYKGELKNDDDWNITRQISVEGSIHDDLEGFLINLQDSKEVEDESVGSFFTPKLTDEEMELVQHGNKEYLKTYRLRNPDVDDLEMQKSDSKSKYVHVRCWRGTHHLNIETSENSDQLCKCHECDARRIIQQFLSR